MQTDFVYFSITEGRFKDIIQQYHQQGLSFIPVKFNSKEPPLVWWTEYQKRAPDLAEIYNWFTEFKLFNVGLITGYGGFYSLDIDDKEAINKLPKELLKSTLTETKRGYHISFRSEKKLRSKRLNINGVEVEFKGLGSYIIEYPAVVDGFLYKVINPITQIKRLPSWLEEKVEEQEQEQEKKQIKWDYQGKAKCIRAILDRELKKGERELSLFILYNLLIQHYPKEKALETVKKKNSMLKNPLSEKELKECIFENKEYNFMGCSFIRGNLNYITQELCQTCEIERGRIKTSLSKLILERGNIDTKLAYYIEIENITNITELSKKLGISRQTVYEKIKELQNEGFLQSFNIKRRKQN